MFTKQQIQEIAEKLEAMGKKNSQFPLVENVFGNEEFSVLQNKQNKRMDVHTLVTYIQEQLLPQFEQLLDEAVAEIKAQLTALLTQLLEALNQLEASLEQKLDEVADNIIKELEDKIEDLLAKISIILGELSDKMDVMQQRIDARFDTVEQMIKDLSEREVTLTVISETPGADIFLNGTERSSVTVQAGDLVVIRIAANGYQTFNEIVCVHKTQTIYITLDDGNYHPTPGRVTFTVNTVPKDASVTMNGQNVRSLTVDKGTQVTVVVSATGYKTKTEVYTVNEDQTVTVTLEAEVQKYTLTVNPTPSNATVTLNGEQRTSITVPSGTSVEVVISAPGYETHTETVIVTGNRTLNITLTESTPDIPDTPEPGIEGEDEDGVDITWPEVPGADYYLVEVYTKACVSSGHSPAYSDKYVIKAQEQVSNNTIHVTLSRADYYTVSVIAVNETGQSEPGILDFRYKDELTALTVPANVKVTPDVEARTVTVTWDAVSNATGYFINMSNRDTPPTGETEYITLPTHTITVDDDAHSFYVHVRAVDEKTSFASVDAEASGEIDEKPVVMCTLTVTVDPEDAVVTINSETTKTVTVEQGSRVLVEAFKSRYKRYSKYIDVTETEQTLDIVLEESEYFTFTLYVDSPEDCNVLVNTVPQEGISSTNPFTAEYEDGDYVRWSVSKEGYLPQSNRFYIHEDVELHITLEEEPEPTAQIIARCLEGTGQIEGMAYVAFNNSSPDAAYDSISLTASETAQLYGVAGEGYEFVAWQDASNPSLVLVDNPLTVNPLNDDGELVDKEYVILVRKVETPTQYTFTINPTPADSIVKINSVEQKSITVEEGTQVSWEVSKEGYITKSDVYTVNSDYTMDVTLEEEPVENVTLTITTEPSNATVKLDSQERKSISVVPGTTVHIEVSASGYNTHTEDYQVNETETKNIVLTARTETSWSNLVLSQAESSSSISAVPKEGGSISIKAEVTVNYSNGETEQRDVTSQAVWDVEGEGCTSDGEGNFTWSQNTALASREATISASVTGPDEEVLKATIKTTQVGDEEYLIFTPETMEFGPEGGQQTLQIHSNASWTIE